MKVNPAQQPLAGQTHGAAKPDPRKVAAEFEAIFASMLIKSMRQTVSDSGLVPKSLGEDIYTDMLDQQYADKMGEQDTFGLARLLLKQIGDNGEDALSSLNTLKGLNNQAWMTDSRFVQPAAHADSAALLNRVSSWNDLIAKASTTHGVDAVLIASVIAQESGGNPGAVSAKGAKGLMQVMDSTARDMGIAKVFDPSANIMGGARYLRTLLDKFGGNEKLALAAYNAGPAAVERYNGIPPFAETQGYVTRVLHLKGEFAKVHSSNSRARDAGLALVKPKDGTTP